MDCLVTNLKGVVNDPSLFKLGIADIKFKITDATQRGLYLNLLVETKVTTDKSVTILNSSGTQEYSSGTEFTLSAAAHYVKPDNLNEVVKVSVEKKYTSIYIIGTNAGDYAEDVELLGSCSYLTAMERIFNTNGGKFDVSLLRESPLTEVNIQGAGEIYGDLSVLFGKNYKTRFYLRCTNAADNHIEGDLADIVSGAASTMYSFGLNGVGITGDIADVGGFPLTYIYLDNTSVVGAIEDLCEAWYATTSTSCYLQIPGKITLNGVAMSSGFQFAGRLAKAGGVLTVKDLSNNLLASYDGNSWTYA